MIGGLIFRSYNGKNATLYGKGAYFAKAGNYAYAAGRRYALPHHLDGMQRLILALVLEGDRTIGYLLLLLCVFFVFIILSFLLYYSSGFRGREHSSKRTHSKSHEDKDST